MNGNERFEWPREGRWTTVLSIALNTVLNAVLMAGLYGFARVVPGFSAMEHSTALVMAVAVVAWFTHYGTFHVPPWRRSRTLLGKSPAGRARRRA